MSDKKRKMLMILEENEFLYSCLMEFFGTVFDVVATSDTEDALNIVKKQKFDIVLASLFTDKMDGFEVTKRIREFNKDIKIIVNACVDMRENMPKALKAGANDFIDKSLLNPEEFLEKIEKVLNDKK